MVLLSGISMAQTFTNYTDVDGLANNSVNCLDVTASDVMWFGTQAGVSVFDGTDWVSHSTSTDAGFVDDVVTAIRVLSTGHVMIGSDFGISVYDGSNWTTFTETDGLGDDRVKTIQELSNGLIAIGTNDGVSMFNGSTFTNYGTGEDLPFGGVTSVAELSNDVVYLGTALGGVTISSNGVFTEITENEGLLNDKVRAVVFDAMDNAWVGTSDGISVFDDNGQLVAQHTRLFELPAPDTLNPIEDLVIDGQGNVWAGIYVDYLVTEGGISAYNGTDWIQFDVSDGLIGPVVRQLAVDSQDNIWVATSTGVSKVSDVDLNSGNSIFDFEPFSSLSIYPNPTSDVLTVELPVNNESRMLEFFDTSLRLVKTETINQRAGTVQVQTNDLQGGIYFVTLGTSVSKLVIN